MLPTDFFLELYVFKNLKTELSYFKNSLKKSRNMDRIEYKSYTWTTVAKKYIFKKSMELKKHKNQTGQASLNIQ